MHVSASVDRILISLLLLAIGFLHAGTEKMSVELI